ncbi:hypothetical protein CAPTEDRAFT_228780 [Capitella teleta]|uniref:Transcription factor TFIIIC triple barrel domain-containing protein n=1 Tax=Capitella teleta TaxID=283909 RepID=R7VMC5_CAPTE|nr:hypothetical protein CAPTEDRAFT_228780 [Capitella teleta]|eukprot:ELU18600.1 hypothetical protein CAPTEDRAFT_228780 [Capitella teleta]
MPPDPPRVAALQGHRKTNPQEEGLNGITTSIDIKEHALFRWRLFSVHQTTKFNKRKETTIVVELSGIADNDWTKSIGEKCQIVGLDSDEPILQMGRYTFQGGFKDSLCTHAIFEKEEVACTDNEPSREKFNFFAKTHKVLDMHRVFLSEKNPKEGRIFFQLDKIIKYRQNQVKKQKHQTKKHPKMKKVIPQEKQLQWSKHDPLITHSCLFDH